MGRIRARLAVALLPWLMGCAVIYSEQPLGEQVAVFKPEEWDGIWVASNGSFDRIRVTDAENGMLAWGFRDGLCDTVPGTKPDQFRQSGPWYFLAPAAAEHGSRYPTGGAFFRHGNALALYNVDEARVRELVEKGALPGRVEESKGRLHDKDVVLAPLTHEQYGVLLPDKQPLFDFQPVFVLVKLPPELDPCKPAVPVK